MIKKIIVQLIGSISSYKIISFRIQWVLMHVGLCISCIDEIHWK